MLTALHPPLIPQHGVSVFSFCYAPVPCKYGWMDRYPVQNETFGVQGTLCRIRVPIPQWQAKDKAPKESRQSSRSGFNHTRPAKSWRPHGLAECSEARHLEPQHEHCQDARHWWWWGPVLVFYLFYCHRVLLFSAINCNCYVLHQADAILSNESYGGLRYMWARVSFVVAFNLNSLYTRLVHNVLDIVTILTNNLRCKHFKIIRRVLHFTQDIIVSETSHSRFHLQH